MIVNFFTLKNKAAAYKAILIFGVLCLVGMFYLEFGTGGQLILRTTDQISVVYSWPNTNPEVIEAKITAPYESAISTLKGVSKISSTTSFGAATINISVDRYTDGHQLRYEISTLLQSVFKQLPVGVSYPLVSVVKEKESQKSAQGTLKYQLLLPDQNPGRVDSLRYRISAALKEDLAVADVIFPRKMEPEIHLVLKDNALVKYRIMRSEIINVLNKTTDKIKSVKSEGNSSFTGPIQIVIESDLSENQLHSLPIKRLSGRQIFLGDVADISLSNKKADGFHTINGYFVTEIIVILNEDFQGKLAVINRITKNFGDNLKSGEMLIDKNDQIYHAFQAQDNLFLLALGGSVLMGLLVFVTSRSKPKIVTFFVCTFAVALTHFIAADFYGESLSGVSLISQIALTSIIGSRLIMIKMRLSVTDYKPEYRLFTEGLVVFVIGGMLLSFDLVSANSFSFLKYFLPGYITSCLGLVYILPAMLLLTGNKETFELTSSKAHLGSRKYAFFQSRIGLTIVLFILILVLGIPLFMLPKNIDSTPAFSKIYNETIGSDFYGLTLKPYIDKFTGGTIRGFYEARKKSRVFVTNEPLPLKIRISFFSKPDPSTVDLIIGNVEQKISDYKDVERLEIEKSPSDEIVFEVGFTPEAIKNGIPQHLRSSLQKFANDNGLATFHIEGYGLIFDNSAFGDSRGYGISVKGYQYDEVKMIAKRISGILTRNPRVRNIEIGNQRDNSSAVKKDVNQIGISKERVMGLSHSLDEKSLREYLNRNSFKNEVAGQVREKDLKILVLIKNPQLVAEKWDLMSQPIGTSSVQNNIKMSLISKLIKVPANNYVQRVDQQYKLVVNYDFLGDDFIGMLVKDRLVDSLNKRLPIGFSISGDETDLLSEDSTTWFIGLLCALIAIFFMLSVMVNSIRFPLTALMFLTLSYAGPLFVLACSGHAGSFSDFQIFTLIPLLLVGGLIEYSNNYNRCPETGKADNCSFIVGHLSSIVVIFPVLMVSNFTEFEYQMALTLIGAILYSVILYVLSFQVIPLRNV